MSIFSEIAINKLVQYIESELIKNEPEIQQQLIKEIEILLNKAMEWIESKTK